MRKWFEKFVLFLIFAGLSACSTAPLFHYQMNQNSKDGTSSNLPRNSLTEPWFCIDAAKATVISKQPLATKVEALKKCIALPNADAIAERAKRLWFITLVPDFAKKAVDLKFVKDEHLKLWDTEISDLGVAEGMDEALASFAPPDGPDFGKKYSNWLQVWFKEFRSRSTVTDPIAFAEQLQKLRYNKIFETSFSSPRDRQLFSGFSAYLRRDHERAHQILTRYLANRGNSDPAIHIFRAKEARMRTYGHEYVSAEKKLQFEALSFSEMARLIDEYECTEPKKVAEFRFKLARYEVRKNELSKAKTHFDQVDTFDARVWEARGILATQKKFKEAVAVLKAAEEKYGQGDATRTAYLRFFQGFYAYLGKDFELSLGILDPTFSPFQHKDYRNRVMYWHAKALKAVNKIDAAKQEFTELSRLAPFDYYGHLAAMEIGEFKFFEGPTGSTTLSFPKPSTWGDTKPILLEQTEILLKSGHFQQARGAIELAASRFPPGSSESSYALYLADLLMQSGSSLKAFVLLGSYFPIEFLQLKPSDLPALSIFFARPNQQAFEQAGLGVEPELMLAMARQESAFQADVVSSDFGYGLLQIQAETGASIARDLKISPFQKEMLLRPEINIRFSAHYVKTHLNKYSGNLIDAVAAYNAGRASVESWRANRNWDDSAAFIEDILYDGTSKHVKNVLRNRANYYLLYRKNPPADYFRL